MLGLRIALSVAKGVIDEIGGLLSKLARRSTYSENLADSRAVVSDIDSYDLLDKATILLTPTATSNARVHSVKDNTSDSDFDFDRASSATRINSSGLVQDMQSITDPELVLNGDFEELGDDLTSPVNFLSWLESSVDSRTANTFTVGGSGRGVYFMLPENKTSKINVSGLTGSVEIRYRTTTGGAGTVLGSSDTDLYVTTTNATSNIYLRATDEGTVSVTDVSVKQVDPNDRWTLGTGWSITNGVASSDGTQVGNSSLSQSSVLPSASGKTYKITFTISNYVSGSVQVYPTNTTVGTYPKENANGTYTKYVKVTSATPNDVLYIQANADFVGSVDNISVKDITFSTDVDLARINYDSNGENGHILLEPTSTNLIPYSEDFEQWTSVNVEVVNNATTSPNGGVNATLIKGNTNTSRHNVNEPSITNTVTASFSVFAKAKELRYLQIASANSTNQVANFDLLNGTIGDVGAGFSDVVIEEYPNDWYKISLVSANQYNSYYISLVSSTTASWLESWSMSNNTDGLYIWGAQLEELSFPTSYIPTLTGSTVTRATETLTGSGNSTLINSTEGVLYAEIAALADDGNTKLIELNDGTSSNRVAFSYNSSNYLSVYIFNGSVQYNYSSNVSGSDFHKVALKYKANDFALWIDGIEVNTKNSGTVFSANTLNELQFNDGSNSANFYGKCKALAVFNEALEDDELELLTGVNNYGSFGELASANGYTII